MAVKLDERLTAMITNNELDEHYYPQMAEAVAANDLRSAYTVVRQGLFTSHDSAFVKAMIAIDARRAIGDFMDYLALAPIEELRQLNLRTIAWVASN